MNLSEIQAAHQKERQKDDLQHLDNGFYEQVSVYLEDLYAERDRVAEQASDPFSSDEVQRLTDTIETVEETVEAMYERRTGKIVKKASFAAAGMAVDPDGTTKEERQLFESLVEELESNRGTVLSVLEGEHLDEEDEPVSQSMSGETQATAQGGSPVKASTDGGAATVDTGGGDNGLLTDAMNSGESPASSTSVGADSGGSAAQADESASDEGVGEGEPDVPRQTVHITTDVGEIFGVDEREYDLREDDIVTLPDANAEVLLEKGAAEALD